jgi:ribosomal protein S18 acetylase RimI-like enzyme
MATTKTALQARSWTKEQYLVSTQPSLIPIPCLIDVFNSSDFYWAKATPEQAMREMVENSLSFGMYEQIHTTSSTDQLQERKFIGLARCVTDYVTFAYLTDVWVDPEYQGYGLGSWLIQCVQEVLETMPHLRRTMLCTADWKRSVPFYERLMGMQLMESRQGDGLAVMESKGKGHPSYGREGTGYEQYQRGTKE